MDQVFAISVRQSNVFRTLTYIPRNKPTMNSKCGHPFNHNGRGASRALFFDFEVPKEVWEFSLLIINDILMISGFKGLVSYLRPNQLRWIGSDSSRWFAIVFSSWVLVSDGSALKRSARLHACCISRKFVKDAWGGWWVSFKILQWISDAIGKNEKS
jgi:hypothetical protein